MILQGNEITIHKGETFTLDYLIKNKDNSPYIISNKLSNPYYLLSLSTTRYYQQDRMLRNYWLNLANNLLFTNTVAIDITKFKTSAVDGEQCYTSFSDLGTSLPYGYIDGVLYDFTADLTGENADEYKSEYATSFYYNYTIFCVTNVDGSVEYKYFQLSSYSSTSGVYEKYECRFVKTFLKDDTSTWVEQSYVYSINLVAGTDMLTYLKSVATLSEIAYSSDITLTDMFALLLTNNIKFDEHFSTQPLGNIDVTIPIITPTKVSVLSSINGGTL